MPANDQKVLQIILEEMSTAEDRCEGYRESADGGSRRTS